jgi:hypothetical protein
MIKPNRSTFINLPARSRPILLELIDFLGFFAIPVHRLEFILSNIEVPA